MNMSHQPERQKLIQWAQTLSDFVNQRGDATSADGIRQTIGQFENDRFMVAVLGKAKRGKSTLLNALLGRRDDLVAPIDKLPASSTITRLAWAPREKATVIFRDGRKEAIDFERIRQFVTEEGNPKNSKEVSFVEVEGPFTGLDQDVVLVDTPGAGSIHEHHDQILHAFIPQSDAVIVLVTARMPLDQDELDLLRQVKKADIRKVFFAINKVDECSEQDLDDAIAHNQGVLAQAGIEVARIHRISAKAAFLGNANSSGVTELMGDIQNFLLANKGRILRDRFISRVHLFAQPAAQALAVEIASGRRSSADLDEDLRRLRDRKITIESDRDMAEREFLAAWRSAVDRFDSGLDSVRTDIEKEMLTQIQATSLLHVTRLADRLPTLLTHMLEERLAPAADELEKSLQAASDRLQASYPGLEMQPSGELLIKTPNNHELLMGAGGGALLAAGGVGVAGAAAAAAAVATTTVTAVAPLAAIAGNVAALVGAPSFVSGLIVAAGTTTSAVAVSAPLWCAIAGPIGWTVAGLGVLMVPLAWRKSKLKTKGQLEDAVRNHLSKVFKQIKSERITTLRHMATNIVEDFRLRLDRQLNQVESAMDKARDHRPSESQLATLNSMAHRLQTLLADYPCTDEAALQHA